LSRFSDQELDSVLEGRAYQLVDPTAVLAVSLPSAGRASDESELVELGVEEWLRTYADLSEVAEASLGPMKGVLAVGLGARVFGAIRSRPGPDLAACGLAVLHEDLLGLFDLVTNPAQRRRGYGAALIGELLGWGLARGAKYAYLQVVRTNVPALALYQKLGFRTSYEYWYRVRAGAG
jgi:ribosomal protein S18 acetylase RimI-like enzyme